MGTFDRAIPTPDDLPGTPEHRRLLRAIAAHYAHDDRVLAVAVFGSLGRGTWDACSDLDLDVVLADGVTVDAPEEVRRLCHALGERPAVVVPDRSDAADVVLDSLLQFSIRYHPLAATSPNIVDSLVLLAGSLDATAIIEAGRANRAPPPADLPALLGACVRLAVLTDGQLHRRKLWFAHSSLHATRERLLTLLARCHGGVRPYHALEAADDATRARLVPTLPDGRSLASVQRALLHLLDLLEGDFSELSAGHARLTEAQRDVLALLRARQADLDLGAD